MRMKICVCFQRSLPLLRHSFHMLVMRLFKLLTALIIEDIEQDWVISEKSQKILSCYKDHPGLSTLFLRVPIPIITGKNKGSTAPSDYIPISFFIFTRVWSPDKNTGFRWPLDVRSFICFERIWCRPVFHAEFRFCWRRTCFEIIMVEAFWMNESRSFKPFDGIFWRNRYNKQKKKKFRFGFAAWEPLSTCDHKVHNHGLSCMILRCWTGLIKTADVTLKYL